MAEMLNNLDAPSDAELISRVRGGDVDAYGLLFARHVDAARRLARQLVRGPDSDDLVSDAFTKVMGALQRGGGPDIAFRAYLLTAVRRLHVDRVRVQSRLTPSDDLSEFDPGVPFQDTVVEQFESNAAARAFATLPERWQMVLWHLEVERQKPAEIAPLLGMTANSVSALAYRAREGLRQAFLSAHLAEAEHADCSWVIEHLGGHVRKGLSKRDSGKVDEHLEGCRSCAAMHLELEEVNSDLSGVIAPLLLGGLAAGYLTATGSGAAVSGGVFALLDRAKDFVVANIVPVAAGTTAAGVATAVVVVGGVGPGGRGFEPDSSAPPPASASNEPASAGFDPDDEQSSDPSNNADKGKTKTSSKREQQQPTTGKPEDRPTPSGSPGTVPGPATVPPTGTPPAGQPSGPPTTPPPAQNPSQAASPTPKPSPSDTSGAPKNDVALDLGGSVIAKGIGRFHAHVSNLPTASGPTPLWLGIRFSHPDVHLQSIPNDCSSAGGSNVSCSGSSGASWNGIFDADMSALEPGEQVTITVTVSASGVEDPDTSNNTRSITLTRTGAGRLLARD